MSVSATSLYEFRFIPICGLQAQLPALPTRRSSDLPGCQAAPLVRSAGAEVRSLRARLRRTRDLRSGADRPLRVAPLLDRFAPLSPQVVGAPRPFPEGACKLRNGVAVVRLTSRSEVF